MTFLNHQWYTSIQLHKILRYIVFSKSVVDHWKCVPWSSTSPQFFRMKQWAQSRNYKSFISQGINIKTRTESNLRLCARIITVAVCSLIVPHNIIVAAQLKLVWIELKFILWRDETVTCNSLGFEMHQEITLRF